VGTDTRKENSAEHPENPVSKLEARVAQLEEDVASLKRLAEPRGLNWLLFNHKKVKPGAREKVEDEDLFRYRDGLIRWLEAYWPWMENRLREVETAEQVGAILEAVSEEPDLRRDWQKRLLPNPKPLFDFLFHERFRKTLPMTTLKDALDGTLDDRKWRRAANQLPTRQIANAMAGVPDVSWRRSLDRCSAHPSAVHIALNMDLYYREVYGLPIRSKRDLTGLTSPLPKPIKPVANGSNGKIGS